MLAPLILLAFTAPAPEAAGGSTSLDVVERGVASLLVSAATVTRESPMLREQTSGLVIHTEDDIGKRNDVYRFEWIHAQPELAGAFLDSYGVDPVVRFEVPRIKTDTGSAPAGVFAGAPTQALNRGGQTVRLTVRVRLAYPQANGV